MHFTGYEIPVDKIKVAAPEFRLLGNLLGSADILAQMADRCYLEKCYDRLYPEFVRGGIARRRHKDGSEEVVFASAADLIFKTPRFYQGATKRLRQDLGGCYNYVEAALRRARTSTSTSWRRTSVTPARSRSKGISPCCAGVLPGPTEGAHEAGQPQQLLI